MVEAEAVRVLDAESGEVVMSMPWPQVQALSLSPLGTFLLTWEKLVEGSATGNLMVWATATGELVTHYVCKVLGEKSLWPLLKRSRPLEQCGARRLGRAAAPTTLAA